MGFLETQAPAQGRGCDLALQKKAAHKSATLKGSRAPKGSNKIIAVAWDSWKPKLQRRVVGATWPCRKRLHIKVQP